MPGDDESMSDEAIWETLPVSLIKFYISKLFCVTIPFLKLMFWGCQNAWPIEVFLVIWSLEKTQLSYVSERRATIFWLLVFDVS